MIKNELNDTKTAKYRGIKNLNWVVYKKEQDRKKDRL